MPERVTKTKFEGGGVLRKKIEGGLCRRGLRRQNAGEGGGGVVLREKFEGGGVCRRG